MGDIKSKLFKPDAEMPTQPEKIVQVVSCPVTQTGPMGPQVFVGLYGLGADGKMYMWDGLKKWWVLA